jgi:ABC-type multidrug transport system ATPase subunit
VFGHDLVRDAGAVRAQVGLLGYASGLYDDLTVSENLRFAARMMGEADDDASLQAALEEVGLGEEWDTRVRALSSGNQRRVALARVRLRAPRLLLLDEPYNSFDPEGVALVNALVRRTRERGGTTLLVAHDLSRAGNIVDRVVRLEMGRLVEDPPGRESGPPEGVLPLHRPRRSLKGRGGG